MSENKKEREEGIPFLIEGYGIKLHLRSHPDDVAQPVPTSWAEVRKLVMRDLMRIAVGPTALLATAFESCIKLISGLSRVPGSICRVIERELSSTVKRRRRLPPQYAQETRDQLMIGAKSSNSDAELALTKIETILQAYRAKGVDAYIMRGPNGQIIIVLEPPANAQHTK